MIASHSFSEWLLILFGACLGVAVGFQAGRNTAPRAVPVESATRQPTAVAPAQARAEDECRADETTLRCVRYVTHENAETLTVDIPSIPFGMGIARTVKLKGVTTPLPRAKRECERIKGILASKLVGSVLGRATKIHLTDITTGPPMEARLQVDGVWLDELLLAKGLARPDGPEAGNVDWCRYQ